MTTDTNAWAAGLFEGEGSVYTCKRKGRARPRIYMKVRMCDEEIVRKFHTAVGCGGVDGPLKSYGIGKKPVWEWRTSAYGDIARLSWVFTPWLGSRRLAQFAKVIAVKPAFVRKGK
jgi:hypothetical protein